MVSCVYEFCWFNPYIGITNHVALQISLYHTKTLDENSRISNMRDVKIFVNKNDELVVYCCDINHASEIMYGDKGSEFYLVLKKEAKQKLVELLGLTSNHFLLEKLRINFGERDSCFEDILQYFEANNIKFDYSRW